MPGLMGDVMDMDGRSIFCDSNELEPKKRFIEEQTHICSTYSKNTKINRNSLIGSCRIQFNHCEKNAGPFWEKVKILQNSQLNVYGTLPLQIKMFL